MKAASGGRTEVVSLLLEAGGNIDLQNEVRECVTYPHPRHTNVLSSYSYDPLEHS